MYGDKMRSTVRDFAKMYPNNVDAVAPNARPATTSLNVTIMCRNKLPSRTTCENRAQTRDGLGKIKAGKFPRTTINSHKMMARMNEPNTNKSLMSWSFFCLSVTSVRRAVIVLCLSITKKPRSMKFGANQPVTLFQPPGIRIGLLVAKKETGEPPPIQTLLSALELHQIVLFEKQKACGLYRRSGMA